MAGHQAHKKRKAAFAAFHSEFADLLGMETVPTNLQLFRQNHTVNDVDDAVARVDVCGNHFGSVNHDSLV